MTIGERIRQLLEGERETLYPILLYGVLVSLFSLVVPIAVQSLVNSVAFGSLTQQLFILAALVFLVLFFSGGLNALQFLAVEILQRRLFARFALDLTNRIPRFERVSSGQRVGPELLNPFLEITILQKSLSHLLLGGLSLILQMVVGMLLMALYHPLLLAFSLVLFLAIAAVFLILGKGGVKTADEECSMKYSVLEWLEDMARMPRVFRSSAGESFGIQNSDARISEWLDTRRRHFSILFRQNIAIYMIHASASALLLGLGGFLVIRGQLTLGQLVASELVVNAALSGLAKFGKHLESYYDLLAAINKLEALRDYPLEEEGIESQIDPRRGPIALSVRNLSVSSLDRERTRILQGFNLSIPAGSTNTLIGHHGSGKSVIVDCIIGMNRNYTGSIQLDGFDTKDFSPRAVRSIVGAVGEPSFFHGTLAENLRFGGNYFSLAELRRYIEMLGLAAKIDSLPEGLQTIVSPQSANFSSGEMLRLSIVRALSCRPRLLIVDHVLDAIDERHMPSIMSVFNEIKPHCTVLAMTTISDHARFFENSYSLSPSRELFEQSHKKGGSDAAQHLS